jgi:acyl-CoA synthetase (AMP-forming)/AMP-acid ligase II/NAD(P)-dependent dehydrogenase (short-subunit alcohol dehydrogenase family)
MDTECPTKTPPRADLSETDGGALSLPDGHPASLAAALERAARDFPAHGMVCLDHAGGAQEQSYAQLLAEAARLLGGLRQLGLKPGDAVLFQLEKNPEFVAAFWACQLGGFVPVPVSIAPTYEQSHGTLSKLRNAWTMLGGPLTLAGSNLAPRLRAFAEREALAGFRVETPETLRTHPPATVWHPSQPDDLALLLLTSGSTGLPKAVRQTQRSLLSWAASTAVFCRFTPADISINWMPLDHVGGIVMFHLRDVIIGCRQVHAPTEAVLQHPLVWLEWIERYRATITWAPNFAFSLVNEQAEELARRRFDLSSMRFILNAGEAIVSKTARRFLSLLIPHGLPATAMRPAWGMSETSSAATYSQRFTLAATSDSAAFVEVGEPIPGICVRIVDQHDTPVAAGKIGRLQIRGISVTEGYHKNPEANQKSYTADGWFVTGDLGMIKDGQVSITGREKDIIIINGVNFYSHELESVVEEIAGVEVSFTAACAIRPPGENTDRIAVFFCPTAAAESRLPDLVKAIRSVVVKTEGVNPDYVIPLAKETIPKTAIGKIQRSQLKQQFERGDYAELVRKYSGQASEPASTPDWFFRPGWRDGAVAETALPAGASLLIFADDSGLAALLARELGATGHPCMLVEPGADFAQPGPVSFRLSPGNLDHYQRLIGRLGRVPDFIVHAWTYGRDQFEPASVADLEAAQAGGTYSLLGLARALAGADLGERVVRLLVVSSQTRVVNETDRISYGKAPLIGLIRTIPQELASVECHHVDLDPAEPKANTRRILTELRGWSQTTETAWRGEARKIPCLEKAGPSPAPHELPFKTGGLYLITGGSGGIGQHFAGHLLRHFDVRLLIVGRTPLPPRSEWKKILADGASGAERIRSYEALEVQGGDIEYVAADVADLSAMEHALTRATEKWARPLAGIFHLAGVYRESLLENETPEGLAAVMRPKVSGTWVLNQLAKKSPGCLFVNFSSVISLFGSLSTGGYAAANNFLDAFSHYQRQVCGVQAYNLLWSSWFEIGMSRGYDAHEALRSRGYLSISAEQGVESLLYAFRHHHTQMVVGLDGSNKRVKKYLVGDAAEASAPVAEKDNFVAPRTEVERQLAKIWEDILGVPKVGLKDNFFELGGRSLLAAKMFAQINRMLGKNLNIPALFKAPTIEQLAVVFLEQPKSCSIKINALQAGGGRAPLFLISDAGTEGPVFVDLARDLGPDQPCFALQARALSGVSSQPANVPEIAHLLAEEVSAICPAGPCVLGSRGFGAVLAWETAQQLTAKGRTVSLLVVIDPPPPAFFAREDSGRTLSYRVVKPAGTPGGMFGRLFKKGSGGDDGVTKELRQVREKYGDARLAPVSCPVALFTANGSSQVWPELAPSGFSVSPISEIGINLSSLLAS